MERPPLPFAAIVVEWNAGDQLGLLRADNGFELRFGGSACHFPPTLGMKCWVVETKPGPLGRGERAKVVNLTGAVEGTPEETKRVVAEAKKEAEAEAVAQARAAELEPYAAHFAQVREWTGFAMPPLYMGAYGDGALDPNCSDRLITLTDAEWLTAYEIRQELEPAHRNPLSERELAEMQAVSMNDVARSFVHDVPFAQDARGWYVFRKDLGTEDDTPVFWCEKTGERVGFAPSFEAFLYHQLIQVIVLNPHDLRDLPVHIARAVPYVRPPWIDHLTALRKNPPKESDLAEIVQRALRWEHLDRQL